MKRKVEFVEAAGYLLAEDEADEESVRRNKEEYFSCVGPQRHALARYLTMIMQRNKQLVTDKRLWRWIALYLEGGDVYMFRWQRYSLRSGTRCYYSELVPTVS
jgi:hypothetical protein